MPSLGRGLVVDDDPSVGAMLRDLSLSWATS
jgi:hypothetical protein